MFALSPFAIASGYRLEAHETVISTNALALERAHAGDSGNLWVFIGDSRFQRGDREGAMEAFERGTQFSHSRSSAQSWVNFIEAEIAGEQARIEFAQTVEREECIITIERILRDDVLGNRAGAEIPEHCEQYRIYVDQ